MTRLEPNQIVRAKVIKMDQAERKIGLSIKSAPTDGDQSDILSYRLSHPPAGATIGDLTSDLAASDSDEEESDSDADKEN